MSQNSNRNQDGPSGSKRVTGLRRPGGQEKTGNNSPDPARSGISGGGGEADSHHTHDPEKK
jgi:hypothetical protein